MVNSEKRRFSTTTFGIKTPFLITSFLDAFEVFGHFENKRFAVDTHGNNYLTSFPILHHSGFLDHNKGWNIKNS